MELADFMILCLLLHSPQHVKSQENVTVPQEPDRGPLDPKLMEVKPPLVVSVPPVTETVDLSTPGEATNLRWITVYKTKRNEVPPDTVCMYNNYTSRNECVCRPRDVCAIGFMTLERGFYCYYSLRGHQLLTNDFQFLQNSKNYELLEWKPGQNGSVPTNGIQNCQHNFVGRNKYGIGNVHSEMKVFYLPWEGQEYWYKEYEVLTVNRDPYHLQVFTISYDTKKMNVTTRVTEELMESKCMANNNKSSELVKEVYMQTGHEKLNVWEPSLSMSHMLTINFSVKVPEVVLGKENRVGEKRMWTGLKLRENISLTTHHTAVIKPGHCCKVKMLGRKTAVAMPFWAQVKKIYVNGMTHNASIVGSYRSEEMGGIKGEPGSCVPIEDKDITAERSKPIEATKPPEKGGASAIFAGLRVCASLALSLAVFCVAVY